MNGEQFSSSVKEVAALIYRHLGEMYSSLKIEEADVINLVIPSNRRGADIYFAADRFAGRFGLEKSELISVLYQRLIHEHENQWHNRNFYGIAKSENSLSFRLVDDSTA